MVASMLVSAGCWRLLLVKKVAVNWKLITLQSRTTRYHQTLATINEKTYNYETIDIIITNY